MNKMFKKIHQKIPPGATSNGTSGQNFLYKDLFDPFFATSRTKLTLIPNGNIYMFPEGSDKGELNLYQAVDFPTKWVQEKVPMKKPIIDPSIISHDGKYWLFGSDNSGIGAQNNGQLEIWYSASPLGPWRPHTITQRTPFTSSTSWMSGGRPFMYDGNIYRVGQDCGDTYGRAIRIFKIEKSHNT
ncbi:unnamed protein product [Cuscuta epithymum]|uniref:Glucosamine inositolphosphorylceramide transferase 1 N-terminal domain-containing protein n=1 Tax=Cuscuta epithymum TaxID=186058 RepID=A0AAV0GKS1_9ASTE|nr:unnamed protein product [Cuscuta epithymum]